LRSAPSSCAAQAQLLTSWQQSKSVPWHWHRDEFCCAPFKCACRCSSSAAKRDGSSA
jgi:hypothetical protein